MPELPEVELVVSHLRKLVLGRSIAEAQLIRERLAPHSTPQAFSRLLRGSAIDNVHRRGKFILLELNNSRTLLVHLRMSGRFMLLTPDAPDPTFVHAAVYFDDGSRLVFADQRHFGFMRVTRTSEVPSAREIARLAPEPFSDEFTFEYLSLVLRRSARPIKELLLDQTKVCGLGNIYASESLFRAGIRPQTRASTVSAKRARRLHFAILQVLQTAIDVSKTCPVEPENIGGSFYGAGSAEPWAVYGREGEECIRCSSVIVRLRQAGRSSFYCRRCQR